MNGDERQRKEITIPKDLVDVTSYKEMENRVSDGPKLKKLLMKMFFAGVQENENGHVKYRDTVLEGINFKDVVVNSCNGIFSERYEPFYQLLSKLGVVFI